jgi:anti-sigma regulatory factor (Ser/Thr protein kinase)
MPVASVALRLRADPASIPEARHAVDRFLGVLDEDLLQDLRLMVSEVVTNSVRHAGLGKIRSSSTSPWTRSACE